MAASEPDDVLDATSPAQLRALSHPTRHRILRAVGPDGATISQLTHRLRINKGNVAHHLGVLVAAGLLRTGRTRTVRGGTEQYYLPVAARIRFPPGDRGVATDAMLSTIAEEIPPGDDHLLNHRVLRLTGAQAAALTQHLESLVDSLRPAVPPEHEYGVLVGLYRRSPNG